MSQSSLTAGCEPENPLTLHDKEGAPFRVGRFRPADRPLLAEFYHAFEPKRAAQGLPPFGDDRIARWLDTVLPQGIHLIACRGGELIGHAFVVPTEDAAGEYAVFLRQDERGRGVGTALNRQAVETAQREGYRRIWLSVAPHNRAAIRSYEKVGFRFRPGTIYSPEAEMSLELEPRRP